MSGRAVAVLALWAAVLACDGSPGLNDTRLVELWVSSPETGDQAMRIAFHDPVEGFDPEPGFQHFLDADLAARAILVVADWPLPAGEQLLGVARLRTRSGALPIAEVTEVAKSDFGLRDVLDGYRVRLVPVDR
jgi:hypothetical protein